MAEQKHILTMGDKEFKDFLPSIHNGFTADKDKLTRIKAMLNNYKINCAQTIQIAEATKNIWCNTIVACYPNLTDAENFQKVIDILKFKDEKKKKFSNLKQSVKRS